MRTNFLGLRSQTNHTNICFESQEISQPKQKNKVVLNGFSNCIFTLQEFFSLSRKVKYIANLSLESLTVICKYVFNREKNHYSVRSIMCHFYFSNFANLST